MGTARNASFYTCGTRRACVPRSELPYWFTSYLQLAFLAVLIFDYV